MNESPFNHGLLEFLSTSPTPFHAVSAMAARLDAAGFEPLDEAQAWQLRPGGRYYVTRNDSSLIAFHAGNRDAVSAGLRMVGAHTDSPCLRVKPKPELANKSYLQLGVEVYGGALLNPWFDRDLSLAGRVTYVDKQRTLRNALVDFKAPVAVIPSLAIHLDREANKKRSINAQTHLPPVLMQLQGEEKPDLRDMLLAQLFHQYPDCDADRVLDFELSFYDTQPPAIIGADDDFIAGARLDNLLSCYTGLMALLDSNGEVPALLVCNDHEEVGSGSAAGARGPFLRGVVERITGAGEAFGRAVHHSALVSTDNAHGIHPNYTDKYDDNHGPLLNHGPVIKVNSSQRYATNSETAAAFRHLCEQAGVPVQSFVVRSDMGCGSTIGPITASELGVRTLDVGVPTFAMHSIRELAGRKDGHYLYQALQAFFNAESLLPR
jgi:aspartyl aminopeptidase